MFMYSNAIVSLPQNIKVASKYNIKIEIYKFTICVIHL